MSSILTNLNKAGYLAKHFLTYALVPRWYYRAQRERIMQSLNDEERQEAEERLAYYCKLPAHTTISEGTYVGEYKFPYKQKRRFTTYFFDMHEVVRYFPAHLRFRFLPGDITKVPSEPTFVKSRPIEGDNVNSVILKLNKRRHYRWLLSSDRPFREKRDMLVCRATWANRSEQRSRLFADYGNHPLCNVGKTHHEKDDTPQQAQTVRPYMGRAEQLSYKFIACIEGDDVATSLKWVMSSNSVAVSPPLHYETWFMEGRLIPNYHYIEVKSDFSDLIEKLNHYIEHPEEAEEIIKHAHEWVAQFTNERKERVINLMVAQKYFSLTCST